MLFSLILFVIAASLPAAPISTATLGRVLEIADVEGVPRSVARQLCIEESGDWRTRTLGDARAIGDEGGECKSRGLYQLHDKFVAYFVWRYWRAARMFDVYDPLDNATVALRYLADLHRRFGTWERACWFYNHGDVEHVPESTKAYAERIINAR